MNQVSRLDVVYEQMIRDEEPNFLRLFLNPYVAQTCFSLDRYISTTWTEPKPSDARKPAPPEDCQSFLANGLEEAVSGAIKLARYVRRTEGVPSTGLILDPDDRLTGFVSEELPGGDVVPFLPGLRIASKAILYSARPKPSRSNREGEAPAEPLWDGGSAGASPSRNESNTTARTMSREDASKQVQGVFETRGLNPLVLVAGANEILDQHADDIRMIVRRDSPLVITCLDRESLSRLRGGSGGILHEIVPDIVVFDESFVNHAVPFSAFTARKSVFDCWNRPGKATFHSTTFQPNSISSRQFMNCLTAADAEFFDRYSADFQAFQTDLSRRGDGIRRFYSPALFRLIKATGFNTMAVRASGSFVRVDDKPVFDGVGGVACSVRGHNPKTYVNEINRLSDERSAVESELRERLHALTGLECVLPAVSGATAVENAIKLALVARFPKRHILALKAGFGGKTLLSLTGTANPSYKTHIDPLYADVRYVDPFAEDAVDQINALMEKHEFALVQLELIQSVGGVRRIPDNVVRFIDEGRKRWGYLLLVDEVQTGMYRTGPFILSKTFELAPDLLLLGKGTSDMMFPCALTLYTSAVEEVLKRRGSNLAETIKGRYGYEFGYKTILNVLRLAEETGVPRQVSEAGALFTQLLAEGLASSGNVRDVRVFGLLIGIEMDARRRPNRWLRKRLSAIYLLAMLRHENFPVFAGLCQYEPNVLKITPPLNTNHDDIRRVCDTLIDVLSRPLFKVLAETVGGFVKSSIFRKKPNEHANNSALALAER